MPALPSTTITPVAPTLPDSGIADGFEGGGSGGTTQSGIEATSQSGGAFQEDGVDVSMPSGENDVETDGGSFFGGIGGNGDNSVTDEVTVPIKQPVVS